MKIAFATIYDARDVRRGSGTYYHMAQELERQGHTVHYVGPLDPDFPRATRLIRAFSKRILKKRYRSYQDPFIARRLGQEVERRLKGLDYDVLLTNDYAIAGYTRVDRPVVLWTDAIFPKIYAEHTNPRLDGLAAPSVYFSQRVNRVGLGAADLCVFPARSTVDEVTEQYGIPSEKVVLIPFGANLPPCTLEDDEARDFAAVRAKGRLDILFVGKDWRRKGWPIAQETVARLRDADVN
ncbi:MAG: glycosyltransferase, partial [Spirochaetes bacterium]|nr:glycosyltransferase [Spirochaetota bacterium]